MKWTYSIKNKLTAAVLLLGILGITLLTNILERERFKELNKSVTSIYEDRLLVESYIFHLYKNLQEHQDFLNTEMFSDKAGDASRTIKAFQIERDTLVEDYAETYLTEKEKRLFNNLRLTFSEMELLENELITSKLKNEDINNTLFLVYEEKSEEALKTLLGLSEIQMSEGASLQEKSHKIVIGSVSISYLQMSIIIILGLVIQALVFSSYTLMVGRTQRPSMN